MYFFKQKGRQILDMRGDLILSHNDGLVRARVKSAAPAAVRNAVYVENIPGMGVRAKLRVTAMAIRFIWASESQAITASEIDGAGQ